MSSFVRSFVKSTLALCVLCAVALAQPKPKAAVYIMGNPEGRDALRSAVNTFLIKSGKYQMIAVDAIDVVAQEQRRQMSGAVSDGDIAALGRDAGAQYVCVVQRSELDGVSYVATRMVSVQSKVAELADIVELPPGGKVIDIIQWQIGSMLGMAVGPRPTAPAGSGYAAQSRTTYAPPVQTAAVSAGRSEPPIQGTIVPGGSLGQKLAWLQKSADSHETYVIEVATDESIAPNNTFEYKGAINITIVMRGIGGNRTIRLSSHGTMFIVKKDVTFVLESNITLQGHKGNTGRIVSVDNGTFKMKTGVTITGNDGGGVYVNSGTFDMNGGTISGNITNDDDGGGVKLGKRYGNKVTFTMSDGSIIGNVAKSGGGVCIDHSNIDAVTFTMSGGTISGNTAYKEGGGLYSGCQSFTMKGGSITNNIAREYGGGICYGNYPQYGTFVKIGGTITGYKNDTANGNAVKDEDGNVISRKGHAIYRGENKRKETTIGPGDNFTKDGAGPWDQ